MNEAPELPSEGQDDLYEHFRFVADKGQQPLRVDKYLMNRIENATRNKIQKAAKDGNIYVILFRLNPITRSKASMW